MFNVLGPLIIALFLFWLLYRVKRRMASIIRNKIIDEFPHITTQLDNLQHKMDYLSSRMDSLERKIKGT